MASKFFTNEEAARQFADEVDGKIATTKTNDSMLIFVFYENEPVKK